jgi:hypothetical protein
MRRAPSPSRSHASPRWRYWLCRARRFQRAKCRRAGARPLVALLSCPRRGRAGTKGRASGPRAGVSGSSPSPGHRIGSHDAAPDDRQSSIHGGAGQTVCAGSCAPAATALKLAWLIIRSLRSLAGLDYLGIIASRILRRPRRLFATRLMESFGCGFQRVPTRVP